MSKCVTHLRLQCISLREMQVRERSLLYYGLILGNINMWKTFYEECVKKK